MFRFIVLTISAAACSARAPLLPDVNSILTSASSKADQFSQKATDIQREVVHQQEESYYRIREQKRRYEAMLQVQEEQTKAIATHVELLRRGNQRRRSANDELQANLTDVKETCRGLRMALKALGEKVNAASLFVQESVRVTDESDDGILEVLTPVTEPPTLDSFLAATGSESASLLQFVEPVAPQELVGALSESLTAIAAAEQAGEEQLKAEFEKNFEYGRSKQATLNATEAQLLEARNALAARQTKLLAAKEFLDRKHAALRTRLDALRVFAQKLDIATGHYMQAGESARRANATLANVTRPANGTKLVSSANASVALATSSNTIEAVASSARSTEASKAQTKSIRANRSLVSKVQPNTTKPALRQSKGPSFGSWFAKLR